MKTLTTRELSKRLKSGPMALFDVRGDIEYEKEHIPGAKTAPLGSLVFRIASVMNPGSEVVVYSGGRECQLAAKAAQRLENLGIQNVYAYNEGLEGWRSAGHSTTSSPKARVHARGAVTECRSPIVDRERAYGGAFKGRPADVEGAGG